MINRQKLIEELNSYHYTAIGMRCGKKVTAEIINGYHDHVIEVIESQPPADQWIPCSERLPEDINNVLMTTVDGHVQVGWYDCRYEIWYSHITSCIQKATAWMPLPEPYKGVE